MLSSAFIRSFIFENFLFFKIMYGVLFKLLCCIHKFTLVTFMFIVKPFYDNNSIKMQSMIEYGASNVLEGISARIEI